MFYNIVPLFSVSNTQHNSIKNTAFRLNLLSVLVASDAFSYCYAECRYAGCCYVECHYTGRCYAQCRGAK